MKTVLFSVAVLVGMAFIGLSALYWLPGLKEGSAQPLFKHALSTLIVGLGALSVAWFMKIAIDFAVEKAIAERMPAAVNIAVDTAIAHTMPEREHDVINKALQLTRAEYTVMPRFAFHQPIDYLQDTVPPDFGGPPIFVDREPLAIPPAGMRGGYPADNEEYLLTGAQHHSYYLERIQKHRGLDRSLSILEFGCSTGRVLRHSKTARRFGLEVDGLRRPIFAYRVASSELAARYLRLRRVSFPETAV
jgi:hypothetical protein